MLDFNDIINKIFKTPSPLSPHFPPLPLLPPPPPAPSAASTPSAPAGLAPPLGRRSRPLCPPPVASSGDIWDVPLLEEEEWEQEQEQEDEEDKDNDAPAGGPRYIIEFDI